MEEYLKRLKACKNPSEWRVVETEIRRVNSGQLPHWWAGEIVDKRIKSITGRENKCPGMAPLNHKKEKAETPVKEASPDSFPPESSGPKSPPKTPSSKKSRK